jgi:hypothetical protein
MDLEIRNYYERKVRDCLLKNLEIRLQKGEDVPLKQEALLDMMCVALNNLPAKYVVYQVDAEFYLADEPEVPVFELDRIVNNGIDFVIANPREEYHETSTDLELDSGQVDLDRLLPE